MKGRIFFYRDAYSKKSFAVTSSSDAAIVDEQKRSRAFNAVLWRMDSKMSVASMSRNWMPQELSEQEVDTR